MYDRILTPIFEVLQAKGVPRVMIGAPSMMGDESEALYVFKTRGDLTFFDCKRITNLCGLMLVPAKNTILVYLAPGVQEFQNADSLYTYNVACLEDGDKCKDCGSQGAN